MSIARLTEAVDSIQGRAGSAGNVSSMAGAELEVGPRMSLNTGYC
jgi:hypothetical protein